MKVLRVHLIVVFAALLCKGAHAAEFIAGADFSHLGFFEDRGIVYKDGGESQDALANLKRGGRRKITNDEGSECRFCNLYRLRKCIAIGVIAAVVIAVDARWYDKN